MTEQELNSVRDLREQIKAFELHLATLRRRAEDITPAFEKLPHASTIDSRIERLALKIVEESYGLDKLYERATLAAQHLTNEFCRLVSDPQERTVLILRYVVCMRFRDICFKLNKSDARVFQIHRDALKKLQLD